MYLNCSKNSYPLCSYLVAAHWTANYNALKVLAVRCGKTGSKSLDDPSQRWLKSFLREYEWAPGSVWNKSLSNSNFHYWAAEGNVEPGDLLNSVIIVLYEKKKNSTVWTGFLSYGNSMDRLWLFMAWRIQSSLICMHNIHPCVSVYVYMHWEMPRRKGHQKIDCIFTRW